MPDDHSSEAPLTQRKVLADFGDFALQSEDLDAVLTEVCRLVGEVLGTRRAKVLEIEPGGEALFVRAGVGWAPDVVGQVHLSMSENSSESFSIRAGAPVLTQDIRKDDRFEVPSFMKDAGVVALANVPIFLPGRRAYGLLQVDDTKPRDFDQNDTEFLRTYATLLGPVIDRLLKLRELGEVERRHGFLLQFNDALRAEPDGDALAHRALRMLCEELRLDRCCVASVRMDEAWAEITHQVGGGGVAPMPPGVRLSGLPEALRITRGRTLVIEDVAGAPGLSQADRQSLAALGFGALVAPALRRGGNDPLWTMVAVAATPRRWTPGEVALLEEAAERTWAAMERARAEGALREREERQAFLLGLSDILQRLATPDEMKAAAMQRLGTHLGVSRA